MLIPVLSKILFLQFQVFLQMKISGNASDLPFFSHSAEMSGAFHAELHIVSVCFYLNGTSCGLVFL